MRNGILKTKHKLMKRFFLLTLLLSCCYFIIAQEKIGYNEPPKSIKDLIMAKPVPKTKINPAGTAIAILNYDDAPSIQEMARKTYRLAGVRVLEETNSQRFKSGIYSIEIKAVENISKSNNNIHEGVVTGFPENVRIIDVQWAPTNDKLSAIVESSDGMRVWVIDVKTLRAKELSNKRLNLFFNSKFCIWLPDASAIIAPFVVDNNGALPLEKDYIQPAFYFNDGTKKPLRTFEDLLQDRYDEALFDYFAVAQIGRISLNGGEITNIGKPDKYSDLSLSPDGKYIIMKRIVKPYSYLVQYNKFGNKSDIYSIDGNFVKEIDHNILSEENTPPKKAKKDLAWRPDKRASLYWIQDMSKKESGDTSNVKGAKKKIIEKIFTMEAPFTEPEELLTLKSRISKLVWANDNNAFLYSTDSIGTDNIEFCIKFSPYKKSIIDTVFKVKTGDIYIKKGDIATFQNGLAVLGGGGKYLFLSCEGCSPAGSYPFIDRYDLNKKSVKRIWQSKDPYYETPKSFSRLASGEVIIQRESNTKVPDLYLCNIGKGKNSLRQLTSFKNPWPSMEGVKIEQIKYLRKDSVMLSGTLYLPAGYNVTNGRLPLLMWAYPAEYKNKELAEKVTKSPNMFTNYTKSSPLLYLAEGYAVLNNASFPIIGKNPNDTYVEQLVSNAEAAINKVVEMGVADRDKIAVSGHSYGGFMTANLLANSNLFAAGIARSGAYNRTLTPFGFQNEKRDMWHASDVYLQMSPFMRADKVKSPILLIHGMADDNSGTFPIQSERLYAALKGNGAIVKLVMLPYEPHGYTALESNLQQAYETYTWMEKYVKNRVVSKK